MSREVFKADALAWLAKQPDASLGNVFTGLPDMHETHHKTIGAYAEWATRAVELCLRKTKPGGYVIFCNTDRRTDGMWIDKSYLLNRAAARANVPLRWHKIVMRRSDPRTIDHLRPTYSHMMCFSAAGGPGKATPDLIPAGQFVYKNATGINATRVAVKFIKDHSPHNVVVDPFVGRGTTLAVANQMGLDAVGVDLSADQVRHARALTFR
jgi:hypothetical protein